MNKSSSIWLTLLLVFCLLISTIGLAAPLKVGAEQPEKYLPLLLGKKVGLVINQTSRINNSHLVDFLVASNIDIKFIFAPEHGFRGDHDAGQVVASNIDSTTGIAIYSIYGKNKIPNNSVMRQLDVVVFDIQDVGTRFYTYISSMHYMMQAAANNDVRFIVLDRPNPNGRFVDGPMREPGFQSFVGMHPIPLLHGMTVGELAKMIVGKSWLESKNKLDLTVIPIEHYQRALGYELPVPPSPNLPNAQAIQLYPSLCLFEPTVVSIGRGTNWPFQVIGYTQAPDAVFSFTPEPKPGAASNPKLKGELLQGWDLRKSDIEGFDLKPLLSWYQFLNQKDVPFFTSESFFDKLAGTDKLRLAIVAGKSEAEIRQQWQPDLTQFKQQRKPYLIYPDN